MTFSELRAWQQKRIDNEGGPLFMKRLPERWLDDPTFRCTQGHVSKRVLRSEKEGDCCLECGHPVLMTFPEDKEDGQA